MRDEPVTKEEIELFADVMSRQCPTHHEWLVLIRFGLPTLLENQPLLGKLIFRHAQDMAVDNGGNNPLHQLRQIMDELGLRFDVAPRRSPSPV